LDVATDIDRLIERRSDATPDPDILEASYVESVRRFNARRRNEDLWDRLRYHEAMLEAHTRTFMQLLDRHKAGRERCEEMLGIGGGVR
jgi:hypothetical protein